MAYIGDYIKESINEGESLRSVIYISGCKHNCPNCFSQQTWNFEYGVEFTEKIQDKIINDIKENILVKGITICGGDSFYSPQDMIVFVEKFREQLPLHTIWVYTGFLYEEILNDTNTLMLEYLKLVDVMVDGKFEESEKDLTLKFRGSSNQRIINIQESLKQNKVILYDL